MDIFTKMFACVVIGACAAGITIVLTIILCVNLFAWLMPTF